MSTVRSTNKLNIDLEVAEVKLATVESGATTDQTKDDIDALGVDADTVDGYHVLAGTTPASGVLKVGDFGIGTSNPIYIGDMGLLDTWKNGWYAYDSNSGSSGGATAYGFVEILTAVNDWERQIFHSTDGSTYSRQSINNGAWTDWGNGLASTATKLVTPRTIDITGDITATAVSFDGTANIAISASVNNNSHTHDQSTVSNSADSDKLNGAVEAEASTVSTIVKRNSSGDINARLFRSEYDTTNSNIGFIMTQVSTGTDNFMRPSTPAQLLAGLGLSTVNKIIGTGSSINTSGAAIIDNIYVTDGVITSMGTRNLAAADIGAASSVNVPNAIATYTSIGGVGSYMWCSEHGLDRAARAPGSTVGGSSLKPSTIGMADGSLNVTTTQITDASSRQPGPDDHSTLS